MFASNKIDLRMKGISQYWFSDIQICQIFAFTRYEVYYIKKIFSDVKQAGKTYQHAPSWKRFSRKITKARISKFVEKFRWYCGCTRRGINGNSWAVLETMNFSVFAVFALVELVYYGFHFIFSFFHFFCFQNYNCFCQ